MQLTHHCCRPRPKARRTSVRSLTTYAHALHHRSLALPLYGIGIDSPPGARRSCPSVPLPLRAARRTRFVPLPHRSADRRIRRTRACTAREYHSVGRFRGRRARALGAFSARFMNAAGLKADEQARLSSLLFCETWVCRCRRVRRSSRLGWILRIRSHRLAATVCPSPGSPCGFPWLTPHSTFRQRRLHSTERVHLPPGPRLASSAQPRDRDRASPRRRGSARGQRAGRCRQAR